MSDGSKEVPISDEQRQRLREQEIATRRQGRESSAAVREQLIAAGVLVPAARTENASIEGVREAPCLRLDDAGHASAASSVAGRRDDWRELGSWAADRSSFEEYDRQSVRGRR